MSISIPNVSLRDGGAVIPQGPTLTGGLPSVNAGKPAPTPLFRDFGKNVNDALTRSFPSTYKVEVTTAQDNGLKFVFSSEKKHDNATNVDSIFVSSQVKFEKPSAGVNFIGTIDSDKLEGEVAFSQLGVAGLKTVFKGKFIDNNKSEASVEAQYNSNPASTAVGLFIKDNKVRAEGQFSAFVGYGLTLGALASYYLPSGAQEVALDNYQLGGLYVPGNKLTLTEVFKASRNPKTGNDLSYAIISRVYYNHDADTKFAADVTHSLGKSFKEVEVKLYGERKLDTNTTGKVGFERSGNVRLALSHKLNNNFTLTVGAQVNALRIEEHSIGVNASFTA